MSILYNNDSLMKTKILSVEADLRKVYEATSKALAESLDSELYKHTLETNSACIVQGN